MSKTCNGCATDEKMSKVIMSSADWQRNEQRHERREKRLVWVIVLLIVLLVGSNIGWLVYESSFETVETVEEYAIEQNADSGNNNSIINGGEIVNGETEDNIQKNN
jgi:preprotein translocase subunit SecY